MGVEERIRQVDQVADQACVSLAGLTTEELALARRLCEYFDLKLGTLVRRADAIRILGDTESAIQRLQEAAQHLICR
jgi:hypothetical protein